MYLAMTENEIRDRLTSRLFGRKIYSFDSIDSTNTYAKSLAQAGEPEGAIVIAEEQSSGRGRFDRKWHSSPEKNLTFSILLRPNIPADKIGLVSLYGAIAVCRAVEQGTQLKPRCKWPNDVLIDKKKVCGILSEAQFTAKSLTAVIIGIGLNVNERHFPADIRARSTSLSMEGKKEYDRTILLASLLQQLETLYTTLQTAGYGDILELWNERTDMMGKPVRVNLENRTLEGTASRLDEDGGLILATAEGEQKLLAGDVTIVS
jgi:BirA family biotin operon repressor/biotin-[acetyl-CoA-carboxylase] ligase